MARTSLPPGFRFHPTDVELVMYYLKRKVLGKKLHFDAIAEVNIYQFSPEDLPDKSCLKSKDQKWFFFCPREKKYASGVRVKRATEKGYWKTTGKDRDISYKNGTVGTVKTLIFHLGHAPQGERTDWVMHEYRILDDEVAAAGVQDTYVVCKVFKKSGPGPKNGAEYGAPFNEADWADDDIDDAQNHDISLTSNDPSVMMPGEQSCPPVRGMFDPGSTSALPLVEEGTSASAGRATSEVLMDDGRDELDYLLAAFTDDSALPSKENETIQEDPSGEGKHKSTPCSDGCEIYNGLVDLDSWSQMNDGGLNSLGMQNDDYSLTNMLSQDNSDYIELDDFLPPLPDSAGVIGTDQSLDGWASGNYINEILEQFYPEESFTGMDLYAPHASQLLPLPEGCSEGDNCLEVLQMGNNQLFCGSAAAANDLDFARGQPENGVNFTEHMERGTRKEICMSRSNPALPPSAAARSLCCGGSSIHIKAEVTHGAGECTNEALLLMMGGSGSWWCILPQAVVQKLPYLICLVEFDSVQILIYCCFNKTLSDSWSYYCRHLDERSFARFSQLRGCLAKLI